MTELVSVEITSFISCPYEDHTDIDKLSDKDCEVECFSPRRQSLLQSVHIKTEYGLLIEE